jgi:hypothetical protein
MTPWTSPTRVTQYPADGAESYDVAWDDANDFQGVKALDQRFLKTLRDLQHTARSPKIDDTNKTWYLKLTGYNFVDLPLVISGINIRISANRRGRISDDTVQLTYQGEPIGKNLAQPASDQTIEQATTLLPTTVYGGDVASWALDDTVSLAMIQDPSFGVLVRFMAHPRWPHKDSAMLDAVELQIY